MAFYFIIAHSMRAGCLCIYIQICSTCKTVCKTMKTQPVSGEGMSAAAPSTFLDPPHSECQKLDKCM